MKIKKPTMVDVAKMAGVSQSAVSMILSGKNLESFPPATVTKVQDACQTLNYTAKKQGRLRPVVSKEILVLATKMTNPYYPVMIQSIEREALSHDLRIVSGNTYYRPEVEQQYLKMAAERKFLAVIFLYAPTNLDAIRKYGLMMPIVAVCDNTSKVPADLVELNDIHAGALAAEYLLSLGHRSIALITDDVERNYAREARLIGIRQKIQEFGEPCQFHLLSSNTGSVEDTMSDNYDYRSGYQLAQDTLLYTKGVTAIIAVNDTLALGVMDALLERGYNIPEDYSILCFNNLLYTGLSRISLTTVDNHADLLAQSAIDVLMHRIHLSNDTQSLVAETQFKIECKPRLIVRNSTCPPVTHNPK